jgi:hypothetical protein
VPNHAKPTYQLTRSSSEMWPQNRMHQAAFKDSQIETAKLIASTKCVKQSPSLGVGLRRRPSISTFQPVQTLLSRFPLCFCNSKLPKPLFSCDHWSSLLDQITLHRLFLSSGGGEIFKSSSSRPPTPKHPKSRMSYISSETG